MRTRRGVPAALALLLVALATSCGEGGPAQAPAIGARTTLDLSGPGWSLWLDADAPWEDDALHLPGVELASLPTRPPSIGWEALSGVARAVSVPGTVEQHTWAQVGDFRGVSWWWRTVDVPAGALEQAADGGPGRRALLRLDAVRLRAEVFWNERLVGYDAVGNTPFEVDVTDALRPGPNVLAVRVTDPGGNFDWKDHEAHTWGAADDAQTIPASHGFGGVTGPVRLVLVDPVHVSDVWVRNGTSADRADVVVTVRNTLPEALSGGLHVELLEDDGRPLPYSAWIVAQPLPPGESVHEIQLVRPPTEPWSLDTPNLLRARVSLHRGADDFRMETDESGELRRTTDFGPAQDVVECRFGFRAFTVEGVGEDAVFRLNGKRIVLRSAISWGFWPVSGMVPTPELARRQVESAKALGLNMLNHHRTIAAPGLLDAHDELGLLAYCEPGGYASEGGDELCRALAREKLLRMIRRDRSRPSVVIWNMINEETQPPTDAQRQDLTDAHALDPSRTITFTSGWSDEFDPATDLHATPFEEPREEGWWDYHNAPGPGASRDQHWNGPDEHLRRSENREEIVFWGEEGAIASPPRLGAIVRELDPARPGWDGAAYAAWHDAYAAFLDEKDLRGTYADVEALTRALASVPHEYQARTIEAVRLGDVADGYVVNGWDGEILENHSGIVDAWRHPKADPGRLAAANAPTRLVVRLRSSIGHASDWLSPTMRTAVGAVADIGWIDETGRAGPHVLELALRDADGAELWSRREELVLAADGRYGRMLATNVAVTVEADAGTYTLHAALHEAPAGGAGAATGTLVAEDEDTWRLVDWRSQALPARGALLEQGRALRRFFEENGKGALPIFHDGLPGVDYVLLGDFDPEPREPVPAEALLPGMLGRYVRGVDPPPAPGEDTGPPTLLQRTDAVLDFDWSRSEPDPAVGSFDFAVRWDGTLTPPESGSYVLHTASDDGVRLWLDDRLLIDHWESHVPEYDRTQALELEAGRAYALRVEYRQEDGLSKLKLFWTMPERRARVAGLLDELLRRAREDGTTLVFLDRADVWAELLAARDVLRYEGRLDHGRYWMGGGFFSRREHAILRRLPSGGALGRAWQELVHYGRQRSGLYLAGEELVIGCVSDHQPRPATALGISRVGKGRILLSTLDLLRSLNAPPGPAEVARKLFCNIVAWAGTPER
ncbi:MAG: PA14 domain-containing protein [Planctomycetota bacterium]|jgi:hypothetical protein